MTWKKILLFLLLASFSFGVGVYYRLNIIDTTEAERRARDRRNGEVVSLDVDPHTGETTQEPLNIAGRINVLLLGEDNLESVKRSDTVMVVTVDVDERNMRVLSLPRDTRVAIPGHGHQKLNHAYAFGKADLLRRTVENFLGISIHYYVKIDYDNFPKLVDAVGGIDIFVGKAMRYTDRAQKLNINIPAGKQRMNGETALKYVRFRMDALGDIGRVQRQQQFLKALLYRTYQPENLARFPSIAEEVQNTIITDMNPSMILQLCLFVRGLEKETDRIFFKMLPGRPALVDNLSYWIADRNDVNQYLKASTNELKEMSQATRNPITDITTAENFSPDSADAVRARAETSNDHSGASAEEINQIIGSIPEAVAVLNGTGRAGVAQQVSSRLQKMGVDVTHVGNAKHFDYRSTSVRYPENASESVKNAAQLLAKLCGIGSSLTTPDRQVTYASIVVGHDYEALLKRLDERYARLQ